MKTHTAPARGMRDLLPDQVELRDHAAAVILRAYARYGFRRVETPALEHLALLSTGEGGDNEKLIYKVMKRGDKLDLAAAKTPDDLVDHGLRYDLTVPLARFYAEHAAELPTPFRAIQLGPVWRAERPQKGRFRQFTQCDIDVLGEPSVLAEVELVRATVEALTDLGLDGLTVRLGDRRLLSAFVAGCGFDAARTDEVFITVDKLDKIGVDGVRKELLGKGHDTTAVDAACEVLEAVASGDATTAIARWRDRMDLDEEGEAAEADLLWLETTLKRALPDGADVAIDPTLVRGMGYYTGPLFEISLPGYPFSMAGGGRYDRMIGRISGRDVPACGFSIGFERVVLVLEERGVKPARERRAVALLHGPEVPRDEVVDAAAALRAEDAVTPVPRRKKLGKQLAELEAQGFDRFALLEPGRPPELRDFQEG